MLSDWAGQINSVHAGSSRAPIAEIQKLNIPPVGAYRKSGRIPAFVPSEVTYFVYYKQSFCPSTRNLRVPRILLRRRRPFLHAPGPVHVALTKTLPSCKGESSQEFYTFIAFDVRNYFLVFQVNQSSLSVSSAQHATLIWVSSLQGL